jgi:hypothetical protein
MIAIGAGRPLIHMVRLCYEADRPLLLVGRHGVGKSELLAEAASGLGIDCICRDLSLMEPGDLVGLPRLDEGVTKFCPPSFLPCSGRGLLVFEELNRCPAYMRGPCLQLLTARSLNDYRLPPGWLPVAAINPPDPDYEVEELDAALTSRFVRVTVEPDRGEWLAWARSRGVHRGVVSYVDSDRGVFDAAESNPRAWTGVGDLLAAMGRVEVPEEVLEAGVAGLVGPGRAAAFFRFLRDGERPLSVEDVLERYPGNRRRLRGWIEAGRLDLICGCLHELEMRLQARPNFDEVRSNPQAWSNLGKFLADLPGDIGEDARGFFAEREYEIPGPRRRRKARGREGDRHHDR